MNRSIITVRIRQKLFVATVFGIVVQLTIPSCVSAQEHDDSPVIAETIIDGLNHPCGVAIQPETEIVFVSDSGNGRVVRIVNGQLQSVVAGYPVNALSADFGFEAGPLGIGFLDKDRLVIGTGCWGPGIDRVGVYEIGENPLTADDEIFSRSLNKTGDTPAEEDFYGMAIDSNSIFVTCRGDVHFGWVGRFEIKDKRSGQFKRLIDTLSGTDTRLPTAITTSPDGLVVVGQRGANGNPSTLGFYDQETGDVRAKFDLETGGLVSLAYGPNTGRLFALFHSKTHPEENGLYKLVARRRNTRCEAQLILKIADANAMAFSTSGELYLATGGESGALLKIPGLDIPRSRSQ